MYLITDGDGYGAEPEVICTVRRAGDVEDALKSIASQRVEHGEDVTTLRVWRRLDHVSVTTKAYEIKGSVVEVRGA